MKKLLILLFSLLISFNSYGKTICIDDDNVQIRKDVDYLSNPKSNIVNDQIRNQNFPSKISKFEVNYYILD